MVTIMSRFTNYISGLSILGATLFGGDWAQAQTSEECEFAISQMGYPLDNYSFEKGGFFSNDKHIYGDIVCEVSVRDVILKIDRNGQILAEDGIFGLGPILLREKAQQTSENRLEEARNARDAAIEVAREKYNEARQEERSRYNEIEKLDRFFLENLLQDLRDGMLNEEAALHFNISPDFLAEFEEDEFLSSLNERREKEARERERERAIKEEQKRKEKAAEAEREAAELKARERALGVPVEPLNQIRGSTNFPEDEVLRAGRIGIQMIHARGWTCDSVSQVTPFFNDDGIRIKCNGFRYDYELTDRGGRWAIELK